MWRSLGVGILVISIGLSVTVQCGAAAVEHAAWDALLKKYVDDQGRVAYRDLQAHDRATLVHYLSTLAAARPEAMTEHEEKAFWINAYNAAIVYGVLNGLTAEGMLARQRFFRWYKIRIAGQDRSPDEIEHRLLRERFRDPRIHFAIVCASTSCPKLRREAYVAERLEHQLDEATREFVNDPARNRIDRQHIALSMIFQWFAADFVSAAGSVTHFIARFVDADKQAILQAHQAPLTYLEYDWTLNAQPGQRPLSE
ncbi:MAG: DUF547 domain-containing protein [Candidatus Binatia bacterium]|nr:DUF547 domain-containing protein [Candidatus Binatia bacterium]